MDLLIGLVILVVGGSFTFLGWFVGRSAGKRHIVEDHADELIAKSANSDKPTDVAFSEAHVASEEWANSSVVNAALVKEFKDPRIRFLSSEYKLDLAKAKSIYNWTQIALFHRHYAMHHQVTDDQYMQFAKQWGIVYFAFEYVCDRIKAYADEVQDNYFLIAYSGTGSLRFVYGDQLKLNSDQLVLQFKQTPEELLNVLLENKDNPDFDVVGLFYPHIWKFPKDVAANIRHDDDAYRYLFNSFIPTLHSTELQVQSRVCEFQQLAIEISTFESATPMELRDYPWFQERGEIVNAFLSKYYNLYVWLPAYTGYGDDRHGNYLVKIHHVVPSTLPTLLNSDGFDFYALPAYGNEVGFKVSVEMVLNFGLFLSDLEIIQRDINITTQTVRKWCESQGLTELLEVLINDGKHRHIHSDAETYVPALHAAYNSGLIQEVLYENP